ncbi:hypothetical protein BJ742DRAFT_738904 [Cladochytrium replicatum]|nr:hypothetical protein BJ742DRAFT_738904 [Cladochytrium replicatum]
MSGFEGTAQGDRDCLCAKMDKVRALLGAMPSLALVVHNLFPTPAIPNVKDLPTLEEYFHAKGLHPLLLATYTQGIQYLETSPAQLTLPFWIQLRPVKVLWKQMMFIIILRWIVSSIHWRVCAFDLHYKVKSGKGKPGCLICFGDKHAILACLLHFYFSQRDTHEQQREWARLVQQSEPLVEKVWGFIDGKSYDVQEPTLADKQNACNNSWLQSIKVAAGTFCSDNINVAKLSTYINIGGFLELEA